MKSFLFWGMVVLWMGCAPDMEQLKGYSGEIRLKQQEVDQLDREIARLKKGQSDSLVTRKIDSLERRKSQREGDLFDLKSSATRASEVYRKDHEETYEFYKDQAKKRPGQ